MRLVMEYSVIIILFEFATFIFSSSGFDRAYEIRILSEVRKVPINNSPIVTKFPPLASFEVFDEHAIKTTMKSIEKEARYWSFAIPNKAATVKTQLTIIPSTEPTTTIKEVASSQSTTRFFVIPTTVPSTLSTNVQTSTPAVSSTTDTTEDINAVLDLESNIQLNATENASTPTTEIRKNIEKQNEIMPKSLHGSNDYIFSIPPSIIIIILAFLSVIIMLSWTISFVSKLLASSKAETLTISTNSDTNLESAKFSTNPLNIQQRRSASDLINIEGFY